MLYYIRYILDVSFLDILEVTVSVYLEFTDCELVCYDDTVWVSLECGKCASL